MKAHCSVIPNGEGAVHRAFGDELTVKLDARATGGTFTLWQSTTPPGGGPPLHFHTDEDQVFMVLDGLVSFYADGRWQEGGTGTIVYAPRGSLHTFRNVGDLPSRVLIMTHPAGFEKFLSRCAEEHQRPEGPDLDRITAISAQHGIHIVNPVVKIETVNE